MVGAVTIFTGTVIAGAIVPILAPNDEEMRINEAAFIDVEFAFLVSTVSREDSQRLVSANRWIAAHGLIVYGNPAVHTAARNQVTQDIGDIGTLGFEAVVGSHDLPAFILGGHSSSEERDAGGEEKRNSPRVICCPSVFVLSRGNLLEYRGRYLRKEIRVCVECASCSSRVCRAPLWCTETTMKIASLNRRLSRRLCLKTPLRVRIWESAAPEERAESLNLSQNLEEGKIDMVFFDLHMVLPMESNCRGRCAERDPTERRRSFFSAMTCDQAPCLLGLQLGLAFSSTSRSKERGS